MQKLLFAAALGGLAGSTSADLIVYEPFDYAVTAPYSAADDGERGVSAGDDAGGWLFDPNGSPVRDEGARIATGNLNYVAAGYPASIGNSVELAANRDLSQSVLPLPGRPFGEGSTLYYSVLFKVNDITGIATNTIGNYRDGSFIAGFFEVGYTTDVNGDPLEGNVTTAGSAGAPLLIRGANGGVGGAATAYQLGTSLTATAADRRWFGDNDADGTDTDGANAVTDFDQNDLLLLVFSYTNNNNADDVARMWINPNPSQSEAANAAALAVEYQSSVNEIPNNQINSFFFRANAVAPDVMQFDELRVSTTWEDAFAVPEPGSVALLSLRGLALARRRRRRGATRRPLR